MVRFLHAALPIPERDELRSALGVLLGGYEHTAIAEIMPLSLGAGLEETSPATMIQRPLQPFEFDEGNLPSIKACHATPLRWMLSHGLVADPDLRNMLDKLLYQLLEGEQGLQDLSTHRACVIAAMPGA